MSQNWGRYLYILEAILILVSGIWISEDSSRANSKNVRRNEYTTESTIEKTNLEVTECMFLALAV